MAKPIQQHDGDRTAHRSGFADCVESCVACAAVDSSLEVFNSDERWIDFLERVTNYLEQRGITFNPAKPKRHARVQDDDFDVNF